MSSHSLALSHQLEQLGVVIQHGQTHGYVIDRHHRIAHLKWSKKVCS